MKQQQSFLNHIVPSFPSIFASLWCSYASVPLDRATDFVMSWFSKHRTPLEWSTIDIVEVYSFGARQISTVVKLVVLLLLFHCFGLFVFVLWKSQFKPVSQDRNHVSLPAKMSVIVTKTKIWHDGALWRNLITVSSHNICACTCFTTLLYASWAWVCMSCSSAQFSHKVHRSDIKSSLLEDIDSSVLQRIRNRLSLFQ